MILRPWLVIARFRRRTATRALPVAWRVSASARTAVALRWASAVEPKPGFAGHFVTMAASWA